MSQEQKAKMMKAADTAGLSHSAFVRSATMEKINRMAQQTNTVQSSNLNVPGTPQDSLKPRDVDG